MILLLICCGSSYCQSDLSMSFTGEVKQDSVYISYDDLRIANAKMIELNYEKIINNNLRQKVYNDSIMMMGLEWQLCKTIEQKNKIKKQRNIFIGIGSSIIAAIIAGLIIK